MFRSASFRLFLLLATVAASAAAARAQGIVVGGTFGAGGFGPYGGFGYGNGFTPYGGFGYGGAGFGGVGYGGYGYGPFNYGQQLYQQQASLTQQIYMQRQQALVGQLQIAQGRLAQLDTAKQQLFEQYLAKTDTEKAAVRTGLMRDYLNLDPRGREGWKRDAVVQIILGADLARLDGLAEYRTMSDSERMQFRQAMLDKYRSLPATGQQAWQRDSIVGSVLGKDWWIQ